MVVVVVGCELLQSPRKALDINECFSIGRLFGRAAAVYQVVRSKAGADCGRRSTNSKVEQCDITPTLESAWNPSR